MGLRSEERWRRRFLKDPFDLEKEGGRESDKSFAASKELDVYSEDEDTLARDDRVVTAGANDADGMLVVPTEKKATTRTIKHSRKIKYRVPDSRCPEAGEEWSECGGMWCSSSVDDEASLSTSSSPLARCS